MTSHPNSLSKARRREALSGYLFLLPSFLGFAIFVIFPILYGIYLSFTNGDGFNTPQWIGLDNYKRLFQDDLVIKSLFNNFTCPLNSRFRKVPEKITKKSLIQRWATGCGIII